MARERIQHLSPEDRRVIPVFTEGFIQKYEHNKSAQATLRWIDNTIWQALFDHKDKKDNFAYIGITHWSNIDEVVERMRESELDPIGFYRCCVSYDPINDMGFRIRLAQSEGNEEGMQPVYITNVMFGNKEFKKTIYHLGCVEFGMDNFDQIIGLMHDKYAQGQFLQEKVQDHTFLLRRHPISNGRTGFATIYE